MGNSYYAIRGVWDYGPSVSSGTYQDDASVIASLSNGFGYRTDDHGNTIAGATPLSVVGTSVSMAGVIGTKTDKDFFSFTTDGANVTFNVAGADYGAMLDASLALYASNGTLIQLVDTSSLNEMLSATLLPGTYDLAVFSAGNYGDLGQYTLSGTIISVPEPALGLLAALFLCVRRSRAGQREALRPQERS